MKTALHDFVKRNPRLFVLSGAGISTASGIPGYRDDEGQWTRKPPIASQDFRGSESARQHYWARSLSGWPIVARARPNPAHVALARLGTAGMLRQLVTQNVDGLHQRAGSSDVIELHGNISRVVCLDCGVDHSRESIQRILEVQNTEFVGGFSDAAPDGDAELELRKLDGFRVPSCVRCGGILKPDVVFFGECVPRDRVSAAAKGLEQADAMLVVGSSLMVYSGFRFCEWASQWGKPIVAINLGRTRADHLFTLKVERSCADALSWLVEALDMN